MARTLTTLAISLTLLAAGPATGPSSWSKSPANPVLGGKLGTCFDVCVLKDDGVYRMYFSWRPKKSVALVTSDDGMHWSAPEIVLSPNPHTDWESDINRPVVLKGDRGWHMWYTGQSYGHSCIGYATSHDGRHWLRQSDQPMLAAQEPWEKVAVMCPHVLFDEESKQYRMWYSAGDQYEPDAIGYATSPDGIHWTRDSANPIFKADPNHRWERHKVTACQVIPHDEWFYMFYIGFADENHAQIGLARSRDGHTAWQRLPTNPIISPAPGGWDADACYKPYALFDEKSDRWLLWYNGRRGGVEQIGLAEHTGSQLWDNP
jgi:predicted GH43/DUF377 family glycosyl hydrolase